jgi:transketolase
MKNTFIKALIDKKEIHSKLVFISVDQETGFDVVLKQLLGDRFIMESISEQYVIGFASGLAADGFLPIIFNHASFTIRRSYEQILLDCCLQERKVILLGMGGGFATSHLGPSHTTFDDIALTRVMPNMEIFIPCGSDDIITNLNYLINTKNSVYVRLSKYGKNNLKGYTEYINSKLLYKNIGNSENLVCVISTGPISYNIDEAVENMEINLLHIHIPFIKDIDKDAIIQLCKNCIKIFIFEEHSKIGGLYSAICEILLTSSFLKGIKVYNFGIDDQFVHKYGTQEEIWTSYKLDKYSIKDILITNK